MSKVHTFKQLFNQPTSFLLRNYSTCVHKKHVRDSVPSMEPIFYNITRFNQTDSVRCWKCGIERNKLSDLFCPKCNIIQRPHEAQNYFKVFNLDNSFNVDQKYLTQKYREMQKQLHPDKFSNSTPAEKEISEEYSSLVNKAYDTLQIPMKRALHLLLLNNLQIEEDQQAADPEFLLEVMELNEEIEDAQSPEKLKALHTKNIGMLNKVIQDISECFKNGKLKDAKQAVIRMKYYNSISLRINEMLRERGIVD